MHHARKLPREPDYVTPNACWSSKPAMEDRPRHQRPVLGHSHSLNDLPQQELIYASAQVIPGNSTEPAIHASMSSPQFRYSRERYFDSGEPVYDSLQQMYPKQESFPADNMYKGGSGNRPGMRGRGESVVEEGPYSLTQHYSSRKGYTPRPEPVTTRSRHAETFQAQNDLEMRQRREEGEMLRDFERARVDDIDLLENNMRAQMKEAVDKLFLEMDTGLVDGDKEVEKLKIEQHFQRLKEGQLRMLMSRLSASEQTRFDNMIDKHSVEMLSIIDQKVPARIPPQRPARRKKHQLFSSASEFDTIDHQALQVAQNDQSSFTQLVYELTTGCRSQLHKVRAIFRWIAVKDLSGMAFNEDNEDVESPYGLLKGIKYGLESYHELFRRLCSYAGMPVKIIRGLSKSVGYRPGMMFTDSHFRNSWAAVCIDGEWHFVDCHWGARYVNNPRDITYPKDFRYALDEFYFLTDADQMIYMHFPDNPDWQLLENPLSKDQFIALPLVKSQFFNYKLGFSDDLRSVIESENGTVEIILTKHGKTSLAFNTRLEQDGEDLVGYCLHRETECEIIFDIALPGKGVYYFTIFVCDTECAESYSNVCCFRIKCQRVKNKPFGKFPVLHHGYGLASVGRELGLKAEKYHEFYLVCQENKLILNVRFKYSVDVSQKLSRNNPDADADEPDGVNTMLDRAVFQRFRDKNFVSFVLRFPERGIYVFTIFAGYKDSGSNSLEAACIYIIQCNAKPAITSHVAVFPRMLLGWYRARLHEPTSGDLKLNKNVKFKLEIANADKVAVIVGQQWFYLKQDVHRKGLWEGVAHTGKEPGTTADVYARYKGSSRDFFPLLEYKLYITET